jgi:hypothetical protein
MNVLHRLLVYVNIRVAMCLVAGAAMLGLQAGAGHTGGGSPPLPAVSSRAERGGVEGSAVAFSSRWTRSNHAKGYRLLQPRHPLIPDR